MYNNTYMKRNNEDIKLEAKKRNIKISKNEELLKLGIMLAIEDLNEIKPDIPK